MNTQNLTKLTPKIARPRCLYRPFTTSPRTLSDPPPPPPPQRPSPPALPSNIARNASRNPNHDANMALAQSMSRDINRTKYNTVRDYDARRAKANDPVMSERAKSLERHLPPTSRWQVGDVYAPHDLSAEEAGKWRKRKSSERDVFDILAINPLDEYKVCVCVCVWKPPRGSFL